MRPDHRTPDQLRPISIIRHYIKHVPGSVLISYGDTKVICAATIEDKTPPFLKGTGKGWLTAEYSMLPAATHTRSLREVSKGKVSGRTNEIQRLIGRSLRAIMNLSVLGERTITIDADVIQADGGTRTAAITGGMIALWDAVQHLLSEKLITANPIKEWLAAVSVGIVNGTPVCDLCYEEDFKAEVDMNIIMTESGKFVEVQGTAEEHPFDRTALNALLSLAENGITRILDQVKPPVTIPVK